MTTSEPVAISYRAAVEMNVGLALTIIDNNVGDTAHVSHQSILYGPKPEHSQNTLKLMEFYWKKRQTNCKPNIIQSIKTI